MAESGTDGTFKLVNVPPNPYRLEIMAPGFSTFSQEVDVRNSVPIQVKAMLAVAGSQTTVTVEGAAEALEVDPSAHVDVDRSQLLKIPSSDPGGSLSQAIVYSTGGVAADGNGFFHPLGDHAQASLLIDGQPISDQQSKVYSTQLPTSAIQSMEVTTGTPDVEFGDKTSLVGQITTRSGLGSGRVFGNIGANFGSFGSAGGTLGLGFGTAKQALHRVARDHESDQQSSALRFSVDLQRDAFPAAQDGCGPRGNDVLRLKHVQIASGHLLRLGDAEERE
jgi:hypothetical protein